MKRKKLQWQKTVRLMFVTVLIWTVGQLILARPFLDYDAPTSKEDEFISEIAPYAQRLSAEYGVLPSVVMAQAILESDWGQSALAVQDKNYFGVKGSAEDPVYQTSEYEEDWTEKMQHFRSYESLYDSMRDYAQLLHDGTTWNPQQYHDVLEADNYKDAANAIEAAGYATDPDYSEKLINIIELYELNAYDNDTNNR
ncbi:glycoside hydrolase family 73 protein [Allofustis seminis]|uniref:glycoside hydrolase family 73 protein n=1 Tax=Allofustis seminis TaxID=166939 RepID=UPI00036523BD|nr:glycoside hydrolase family 73 protein [Allofustis seminis]